MGGSKSKEIPPPPPPNRSPPPVLRTQLPPAPPTQPPPAPPTQHPSASPTQSPPASFEFPKVTLIDIYGHRTIKDINPSWLLSRWAKSLKLEYTIKNVEDLTISVLDKTIKYSQSCSQPLESFGIKGGSEIFIMHEWKGSQNQITLFIYDTENNIKTIKANLECTYKDFCEIFLRTYGTPFWVMTIMHKTRTLFYDSLKNITLKDLGISDKDSLIMLTQYKGGSLRPFD